MEHLDIFAFLLRRCGRESYIRVRDFKPIINESDIILNEIRFFFTKRQIEKVEEILTALAKKAEETDQVIFDDYYRFIGVMSKVKKSANIKNSTVAFLFMLKICEEWIINEKEKA